MPNSFLVYVFLKTKRKTMTEKTGQCLTRTGKPVREKSAI